MTEHESTKATSMPASPWHTSSYSVERGECVEVAEGATGAAVRDTKNRVLGALFFDSSEWQAFLGTMAKEFQ